MPFDGQLGVPSAGRSVEQRAVLDRGQSHAKVFRGAAHESLEVAREVSLISESRLGRHSRQPTFRAIVHDDALEGVPSSAHQRVFFGTQTDRLLKASLEVPRTDPDK